VPDEPLEPPPPPLNKFVPTPLAHAVISI
jgi:hypothetical protein